MSENELMFIAKIERLGPIDAERKQTIQLKDVAVMNGHLFSESDGFVKIMITKSEDKKTKNT